MPASIALVVAAFVWRTTPDTPPSVGLPEVEGTRTGKTEEQSHAEFKTFVIERVFKNKYVWLVSVANFFVYTVRYAVLDWGPTILGETKHIHITHAGWMVAAFEVCGVVGAIFGGWLTDRFLGGRAMRMCVVYMILAGVSVLVFWKVPVQSEVLTTMLLGAVATAVGLTSIFGYASTVLSGWGLGTLVQHYGWDAAFQMLLAATVVGTLLFIAAWPAKSHGYED